MVAMPRRGDPHEQFSIGVNTSLKIMTQGTFVVVDAIDGRQLAVGEKNFGYYRPCGF